MGDNITLSPLRKYLHENGEPIDTTSMSKRWGCMEGLIRLNLDVKKLRKSTQRIFEALFPTRLAFVEEIMLSLYTSHDLRIDERVTRPADLMLLDGLDFVPPGRLSTFG